MLHVGNLFHSSIVKIFWKPGEVNVNDLLLVCWLIIVPSGIMTQKVGSESLLLFGSVGVLSWDGDGLLLGVGILGSPFFVLARGIGMVVKSWSQLTLLLRFLWVDWFWLGWTCGSFVVNFWSWDIVDVYLLFIEGSMLRVIGLLKNTWCQLILSALIWINVPSIVRLSIPSISVPSGIWSWLNSWPSIRVISFPWSLNIFILMSKNTGLKILSFSLISCILWLFIQDIGHSLSNLLLRDKWWLAWPIPFSIEFLSLSHVSGFLVELWWLSLLLLTHHSCERLLLLPLNFFISPHALVASSFLGKAFPCWDVICWPSENSALPLSILTVDCRSWSSSSLAWVGLSECWACKVIVGSCLLGLWGRVREWLNSSGLCLVAEDIWVLVRLSCCGRLNCISGKLSISCFIALESLFVWSFKGIESNVTLEGTSFSKFVSNICWVYCMGKDVTSDTFVKLCSCLSHFRINFLFIYKIK